MVLGVLGMQGMCGKISNNLWRYLGEGSKVWYLYFVCMNSVSSIKLVSKIHQSSILHILAASLILNTKTCI